MGELRTLPWKRDATACERLSELALYAQEHPERFERFVICYTEKMPSCSVKYRIMSHGCDLAQAVGLYEIGKGETLKDSDR